jgi:3-oxoacyl-(acyl-carrier-protein) synthase
MDGICYPQQVHWFPETYKGVRTGMSYVPHRVADKVLDGKLMKILRENPIKTAFILAAGNAHFAGIEPKEKETHLSYNYKFMPLALTQVYAGRTAQACGAYDHIVTDSTACASSLKVMMDVQTLIKFYGFERVIVLTLEDPITNTVLKFFGDSKAVLTTKVEEETGVKPSAFDPLNYGFHIGQGAAFAVFETEASMKLTGFKPKAELVAAYTSAENCSNSIGQNENGEGFKRAIHGVLDIAKIAPKQVTTIKTHGTGTKSNNVAEKTALTSIFNDFVATSFKQRIGHTMGASGLLETLLLLDNVKNGFVPPIVNRTDEDEVFLSKPAPFDKDGYILSLAAGMGNVYSAAIFKDAQC